MQGLVGLYACIVAVALICTRPAQRAISWTIMAAIGLVGFLAAVLALALARLAGLSWRLLRHLLDARHHRRARRRTAVAVIRPFNR